MRMSCQSPLDLSLQPSARLEPQAPSREGDFQTTYRRLQPEGRAPQEAEAGFPGQEEPSPHRPKTVIFVPVDLMAGSFEAAHFGACLARQGGGLLVLFHVIHLNLTPYGPANPAWLRNSLRREAMEKAEPFMRFAVSSGVSVISDIEEGAIPDTILKGAKRWEANMILLGTRERRWFEQPFRRRTVENVLRQAPCPVLVLPVEKKKN